MKIRVFTLPFDQEQERFPDELVEQFCANKKVAKVKSKFFESDRQSFWTIAVHYELLPSKSFNRQLTDLDEGQQMLYELLANWRKEKALHEEFPPYLVCKNKQFIAIIEQRCTTLDSLSKITGIGKAKLQKYGKEIIQITRSFYEGKSQPN